MGWTRRQNLRRSYWMRGRIVQYTRYMALWDGILVVRRDMAFTSKACPKCGPYGERFFVSGREHEARRMGRLRAGSIAIVVATVARFAGQSWLSCKRRASFVTGTELVVDGGQLAEE